MKPQKTKAARCVPEVTPCAYEGEIRDNAWWFPTVTSVNSHQKTTFWTISVRGHGEKCSVVTDVTVETLLTNCKLPDCYYASYKVDSGVVNGKTRDVPRTIITAGKNPGRANETNVFCQAMNEARGKYRTQLRKAATPIVMYGVQTYPPMLAQEFDGKVTYPVFLQYKYDGLRAVAVYSAEVKGVIMYTRTRKEITGLAHIKSALLPVLKDRPDLYLDGEVYKHGVSLQTISGLVREETPSQEASILDFILYDSFVANDQALYKERLARLVTLNLPAGCDETSTIGCVKLAKTWEVSNVEELNGLYKEALDAGYEGVIIRKNNTYELSYNNRHSKMLLKLKPESDAEFEVVGWKMGDKGKTLGALIMVCKTTNGHLFSVNPAMPIPDRIELAKQMSQIELNGRSHFDNEWLGKHITVKFAQLSDDGVPLQPRTTLHKRID